MFEKMSRQNRQDNKTERKRIKLKWETCDSAICVMFECTINHANSHFATEGNESHFLCDDCYEKFQKSKTMKTKERK